MLARKVISFSLGKTITIKAQPTELALAVSRSNHRNLLKIARLLQRPNRTPGTEMLQEWPPAFFTRPFPRGVGQIIDQFRKSHWFAYNYHAHFPPFRTPHRKKVVAWSHNWWQVYMRKKTTLHENIPRHQRKGYSRQRYKPANANQKCLVTIKSSEGIEGWKRLIRNTLHCGA